jgi:8-hydroxy-5-deazaflavin:NADPH oxidoreductase
VRIGILGTGRVATALGTALDEAGHQLVLGSRTPDQARDDGLAVASPRDAAEHGEVVLNGTNGLGTLAVLAEVGPAALAGKPLWDLALAVNDDMTLAYPNGSLAERIQREYPDARVVKALSSVPAAIMVEPALLETPPTAFLSGDDAAAKQVVAGLLAELGWPAAAVLDLGGIDTARGPEHLVPLLLAVFTAVGGTRVGIAVVR